MKKYILIIFILLSCSENNDNEPEIIQKRSEVIIENNVFKISYNENKEQPNWIEYTVKDFVKVADRGNNKKFDPNFHQAMSEIEDEKKEAGTILNEIQAGYMLGDRLLRPALVSVSKKESSKEQENKDKKEEK